MLHPRSDVIVVVVISVLACDVFCVMLTSVTDVPVCNAPCRMKKVRVGLRSLLNACRFGDIEKVIYILG